MVSINKLFSSLVAQAQLHNHRRLLVITGPINWCEQQAISLFQQHQFVYVGAVNQNFPSAVSARQAHQLLGQSLGHVIFNAWDGLNPNAFGQISGAISGGHVLVLLCPELDHWAAFNDPEHEHLTAFPYQPNDAGRRFISRFVHILQDDVFTVIAHEDGTVTGFESELPEIAYPSVDSAPILPSKTQDQQQAVELILNQFRRGRRPVVITADRGRGKTSALGIAAAQLSGLDNTDIIITAPELANVQAAFSLAHTLLPHYMVEKGRLFDKKHQIRYLPPTSVLDETGEGKILLVDEAASIPVPMLEAMLDKYPRVVFSSTKHGYEGTGQGFAIRFSEVLKTKAPNTKSLHLDTPIRWNPNDPLENCVFNALLLNAEAAAIDSVECKSLQAGPLSLHDCQCIKLDRDSLLEDYQLLSQLFGLLINAHYKTSPSDLRILLDSPNIHIWLSLYQQQVVGAVLVAEEGPLPNDLVEPIWAGQRRPRGHLMPQTLVNQEGYKNAASLRCGRIVRIAVHPRCQQQGLGRLLLQTVVKDTQKLAWDYLGASFATDPAILLFWEKCGFLPVRLGHIKDPVSGCHAALTVYPQSETATELITQVQSRFNDQLSDRLSDDLRCLEPLLVCALLKRLSLKSQLDEQDMSDLVSFSQYNRSYESCAFAIRRALLEMLVTIDESELPKLLASHDFVLLIRKNIQHWSWQALEQDGLGRKAIMLKLKRAVALLVEYLAHQQ